MTLYDVEYTEPGSDVVKTKLWESDCADEQYAKEEFEANNPGLTVTSIARCDECPQYDDDDNNAICPDCLCVNCVCHDEDDICSKCNQPMLYCDCDEDDICSKCNQPMLYCECDEDDICSKCNQPMLYCECDEVDDADLN